ncbi:MAG: hypothetical protein V2B18_06120, partial [Pseudomonadota bacterium]
ARLINSTPRDIWLLNSRIFPETLVFPAKHRRKEISHTINVPKGTKAKFVAQLRSQGYTR